VCPAGSARTGGKLTVKAAGNGDGSGKTSSAAKSGGKGSSPATCSACAADSFAPESKPVPASRCTKCPTGTTTRGETGSATCYVEPGTYFDPTKPDGQQVIICPADQYCPGGDIFGAGLSKLDCPAGSTTFGTTGNDVIADCVVPPGSYYDGSKVVLCTAGSYCTGGPVDGAGSKQTPCPAGETSNPGAAAVGQCFRICAPPTISCPAGCIDPSTDSKNCGACGNTCKDANTCFGGTCGCGSAGNICPAGATCKPFGTTQTPTCICDAFNQPVFTPERLACNTNILVGQQVKASCLFAVDSVFRSLRRNRKNLPLIAHPTC